MSISIEIDFFTNTYPTPMLPVLLTQVCSLSKYYHCSFVYSDESGKYMAVPSDHSRGRFILYERMCKKFDLEAELSVDCGEVDVDPSLLKDYMRDFKMDSFTNNFIHYWILDSLTTKRSRHCVTCCTGLLNICGIKTNECGSPKELLMELLYADDNNFRTSRSR